MKGAIAFLAAVLIAWGVVLTVEARPTGWDVSYPIANSRIVWEGAGYDGVWSGDYGQAETGR